MIFQFISSLLLGYPQFCLRFLILLVRILFISDETIHHYHRQFMRTSNNFQKKLPFWRITSEAFVLWLMFHKLDIHEIQGILRFAFLNENYNNELSCFFDSHCRLVLSFTKAHSICRSFGEKRGTYFVNLISSNFDSNIIAFSVLTSGRDFSVLDHC